MAQIQAAYYGDEKSFTNVTKSLLSMITNGSISTIVSSALKPQFERTTGAALTPKDQDQVTKRAIAICGTAADTECMKGAKLRASQDILREKEREATSGANMIKGNRLTVDVIDEKGVRKQIVVPENQTFTLNGVVTDVPPDSLFPDGNALFTRFWQYVSLLVGTLVYVLGILIPYALFMREAERAMDTAPPISRRDGESDVAFSLRKAGPAGTWKAAAYGTAFLSAIIPYSGLIISLLYYVGQSFVREYIR